MKVAKGMTAIFAIKLILFVSVFTFQACTIDENSSIEIDNSAFKNALKTSTSRCSILNRFICHSICCSSNDNVNKLL